MSPFSAKAVWNSRSVIYRMCLFSINLTVWVKIILFLLRSVNVFYWKRCLIPWQTTSSNNNHMFFFSWEITSVHSALSVPLWSVYLCSNTDICCLWKLSVCHDPRRKHSQFLQPAIYTHLGPWTTISISIVAAKHFVCYYLKYSEWTTAQTSISKYVWDFCDTACSLLV